MIAYLLSFLLVTAVYADVYEHIEAANEPANMDGYQLVQLAVEDGERLMDRYPPQSCYAAWWALERASLRVLAQALRFYVMGDPATADALLDSATVNRWLAQDARKDVTC